jgi:hypothetical protein
MKTATKTSKIARNFVKAALSAGWRISSRENVVTITKGFTAELHGREQSRREFVQLDGEYYGIMSILPHKGSIWGTDGSGVGGYSAMLHGVFTMNVSGVSDKMIDAIYAEWDAMLDETTGEQMTY